MKRSDRIKIDFIRNWKLPGRERLSHLLKPSSNLKKSLENGIIWLTDENIAIFTTADNYIEWTILTTGTYEREINKLIRLSIKPGGVALDIGGNIGLQSLRMAECAGPDGQVYAFEPLDYLQEKFRKNLALNKVKNVRLFPFALSDQPSEGIFNIDPGGWNQGAFSIGAEKPGIQTQLITIKVADEIPEIKALDRIDLIKIDVEGFEFHVLRGLSDTIRKFRPRIIFEYDAYYWRSSGQEITACYNLLAALHYEFYQITPVGCELITDPSLISGGNLFCLQQS